MYSIRKYTSSIISGNQWPTNRPEPAYLAPRKFLKIPVRLKTVQGFGSNRFKGKIGGSNRRQSSLVSEAENKQKPACFYLRRRLLPLQVGCLAIPAGLRWLAMRLCLTCWCFAFISPVQSNISSFFLRSKPILLEWRQKWEKVFEKKDKIHDYVFFNAHTRKKMSCGFGKIFREVREKAGLPNLTPHGLRHYFISHALMSRVPKDTIREWVGHTSTKMIDTTYGASSARVPAGANEKICFLWTQESESSGGERRCERGQSAITKSPVSPKEPRNLFFGNENENGKWVTTDW